MVKVGDDLRQAKRPTLMANSWGKTISWRGQRINDARTKVRDLMLYSRFWWGKGRGIAVNIHVARNTRTACFAKHCAFAESRRTENVNLLIPGLKVYCPLVLMGKDHVVLVMNERWGCDEGKMSVSRNPGVYFAKSVMPVFCRKKCCVGWSQCKIQLMYSSSRNELHFAWSSFFVSNDVEWTWMSQMKPWGCTHEKRRQDRLHSASGPAGSTDAAFDGAGLAGPLSVSEFCFRGLRFFHKQIPAKLPGSRFADSLIHRLSTHFPELTGAVAQRRERNAALCAIQKPVFFIFETLSSLSLWTCPPVWSSIRW